MITLSNFVKNNFDGMLVVGDVHGDYNSLLQAFAYSVSNNYFFMSLGDLVDRGPDPYHVVKHVHDAMKNSNAGFTIGNHDHKFRRFAKGSKVNFARDARGTIESVGEDRMAEFLRMYTEVVEHPTLSGYFHKFGDISLWFMQHTTHTCMTKV